MKIQVSKLVMDFALYPRGEVDGQHVHYMREAIRSGATFPPVIVEAKSLRVIDGFHRVRAFTAEFDEAYEIEITKKSYANDGEMFLDAVRYNAAHGRTLSIHDKVLCILKGEEFKITPIQIANALHITAERVGVLRAERVGIIRSVMNNGRSTWPLKRTIQHMAGKTLSTDQVKANDKLSGMNQSFYVNQVIILIENNLLDTKDEKLMERLGKLAELLGSILIKA